MPTETELVFERLTLPRVRVLCLLSTHTLAEVARGLGYSYVGVRSHVRDLKDITGCATVRQLACWWQDNRAAYLEYVRRVAEET